MEKVKSRGFSQAEKAQKELDALKATIQADAGAAEAVQQEERLAQAHAELATLHEREGLKWPTEQLSGRW